MIRVEQGDCLEVIPRLVAEGVQADAIVTDPPYHLTSGSIAFDWENINPRGTKRPNIGSTNKSGRAGGFMGQKWDGGDISFRSETWAAMLPILKPGGFLLAFGGSRTFHRIWYAIEAAGFVLQDTLMFLHGSGFPKGRWQLKPAFEPICLAYKPGGTRALQVDECRIPTGDEEIGWNGNARPQQVSGDELTGAAAGMYAPHGRDGEESADRRYMENGSSNFAANPGPRGGAPSGRWPANVAHDGSDEVMAAFPDAPGMQYGVGARHGDRLHVNTYGDWGPRPDMEPRLDGGSAARFFYSAKADAQDRWGSRHPTVKPVELLKWLVPLVTPPGGTVLDCFAGSGTTGAAALATGRNAILIEREAEYIADIKERLAFYEGTGRHSLSAKNRHRKASVGALI